MTKPPLCRYCGKPIAKSTTHEYLVAPENSRFSAASTLGRRVDKLPQTKAEAQLLFNQQIVSVSRCRITVNFDTDEKADVGIDEVRLWDGKSYVDQFFCNGDHARRFGYAFARAGFGMAAWQSAIKQQQESKS